MVESKKIVKMSLSDQVYNMLKENIMDGVYPVNSRIPSETELAGEFGVSRLTVRMALQKLNAQGLTVTRPGDGTFVKQFDLGEYLQGVSDVTMRPEVLDSVLEFRQVIETATIQLAIERASSEDLDKLDAIIEEMESLVYEVNGPEEKNAQRLNSYTESDFMFHYTICQISGNALFEVAYLAAKRPITVYMHQVVERHINDYRRNHPRLESFKIEQVTDNYDHRAIVLGMRAKNRNLAHEFFSGPVNHRMDMTYKK